MRSTWRKVVVGLVALLLMAPMAQTYAAPAGVDRATPANDLPAVELAQRDDLLGAGWQSSGDRSWTTTSDAAGLHVLVAEAKTGYSWHTAATLSEPGLDADQWIGNACVTGSGTRVVVVYAPRTFTNNQALASRGGFTAIVDLASGAVTKLPVHTSLAYFNPGCGVGETAALTQEGDEDLGKTGVLMLDAATGKISPRTELAGQVTSATPVPDGFVVADAKGLLKVATSGVKTRLVGDTDGVPYAVKADASGGVVFMDHDGAKARVFRVAPGAAGHAAVSKLATGPVDRLSIAAGAAGKVFITGDTDTLGTLPAAVTKVSAPAGSEVSTLGQAAVMTTRTETKPSGPAASALVHIQAASLRTGKPLAFKVDPDATPKPRWTDDNTDPGHVCSIPRNDPKLQVFQPKPKQVEWAADQAVKDALAFFHRPAGWHNNGLPAYVPQDMFPPVPLTGGGLVPAQILLGILGQESNLWQAARTILPGETGNPLIGSYYGVDLKATGADYWTINWAKADCGYGVGQVTDGMRIGGLPHDQQVAIATDYAANVSAALNILIGKWNQLQQAGVTANNNDPAKIENWFLATWAYNSGYHAPGEAGSNGAYGLGWLNNPINPRYPARHAFGSNPHDFATPQQWPYEEKVLGFASYPPSGYESPANPSVPFFRAAWWNTVDQRNASVPDHKLFCTTANNCDTNTSQLPTAPEVVGEPAGPCQHTNSVGQYDLKCFVHSPVVWNPECATKCGHEFIRYDPELGEPDFETTNNPPACDNDGLQNDAEAVDDISDQILPIERPSCQPGSSTGSFDFVIVNPEARIDLHQVGGGYASHFWYDHARLFNAEGFKTQITGVWSFTSTVDGLARVLVHLPARALNKPGRITYQVDTATGRRSVPVDTNRSQGWVELGVFPFMGKPVVRLDTIQTGVPADGSQEIYWDAAAIETARGGGDLNNVMIWNGSYSDKCVKLKNNTPANGAVVETRNCGYAANYWHLSQLGQSGDKNKVAIVDRGTGLCMGVKDGSTEANAPIVEVDCVLGDPAQSWWIPAGNPDGVLNGPITNVKSGYAVGLQGGLPPGPTPLTQQSLDDPTGAQSWHISSQ
jgi:hypothetical protein